MAQNPGAIHLRYFLMIACTLIFLDKGEKMEIDDEKSPQKENVINEEPMETDNCDKQQSSSTDNEVNDDNHDEDHNDNNDNVL